MTYKLVIYGRLPGLNEYTSACRTHAQAGAKMKKEQEALISACIDEQLQGIQITCPVDIHFSWIEANERRDPDNVSGFGRKVILDALVRKEVLPDDSRRYIKSLFDSFGIDKKRPRIEVRISERAV